MGRTVHVLHSALVADSVAGVLRRSIDEKHWTLFSLSGYRGNQAVLGEVGEGTFRVQKRRYYTGIHPALQFYARFAPEPGGTRIEGYFNTPRLVRYFMWIWLGFAVLVGTPIFVATAVDMTTGSHYTSGDDWVGLIVPPALVLFGIVLLQVSRLAEKAEERFILEFVRSTLAAREDGF